MPLSYKGFWISMAVAIVAYAAGISMAHSAVALLMPLALWSGSFCNAWLRSRLVGWVFFTFSFVCWMTVLGAFTLRWRMEAHIETGLFARALVLYGALAMAGLYQLRGKEEPNETR
jgi:hypothetical protein